MPIPYKRPESANVVTTKQIVLPFSVILNMKNNSEGLPNFSAIVFLKNFDFNQKQNLILTYC